MKYVKILGLLAVAATALMAFAATASADIATSPTGTVYTGSIVAEAEGHAVLDNPVAKIECASKVEGTLTTHGKDVKVSGPISSLTFGSPVGTCTGGWHVTVLEAGVLSVDAQANGHGDVFSKGATVESTIKAGESTITCRYATNTTTVGTLTPNGDGMATMDISAAIPFHSGSPFCGSGATTWTGSYTITTPGSLSFDAS